MKICYSYILLFYLGFNKLVRCNGDSDFDLDSDLRFLPELASGFTAPPGTSDPASQPQQVPPEQPESEGAVGGAPPQQVRIDPEQENIPFYYNKDKFDLISYVVDGRRYYKLIPRKPNSIRRIYRGHFQVWERTPHEQFTFAVFSDPGDGIPVMHIFIRGRTGFRRFIYNRTEGVFFTVRSSTTTYKCEHTTMKDTSAQTDDSFLSETSFMPGEKHALTPFPQKQLTLKIPEKIRERARERARLVREKIKSEKSGSESESTKETDGEECTSDLLAEALTEESSEVDESKGEEQTKSKEPEYQILIQQKGEDTEEDKDEGDDAEEITVRTKHLVLSREEYLADQEADKDLIREAMEESESGSKESDDDLPEKSTEEEFLSDEKDENKENEDPEKKEKEEEEEDDEDDTEVEDEEDEDKDKDGHGKGDDEPDEEDDGNTDQGDQGDGSAGHDSTTGESNDDYKGTDQDKGSDDKGHSGKDDHTDGSGDSSMDSQKFDIGPDTGKVGRRATNDPENPTQMEGPRTPLLSDSYEIETETGSNQNSPRPRSNSPDKMVNYEGYGNPELNPYMPGSKQRMPKTPAPAKPPRRSKSFNTPVDNPARKGNPSPLRSFSIDIPDDYEQNRVSSNNYNDQQKDFTFSWKGSEDNKLTHDEIKTRLFDEPPIEDDDDEDDVAVPERKAGVRNKNMTQGEEEKDDQDKDIDEQQNETTQISAMPSNSTITYYSVDDNDKDKNKDPKQTAPAVIEMKTFVSGVNEEGEEYETNYEKETEFDPEKGIPDPRSRHYSRSPFLRGTDSQGRLPRRINIL